MFEEEPTHQRNALVDAFASMERGRYLDAWRTLCADGSGGDGSGGDAIPSDIERLCHGIRAMQGLDLNARAAWWVRAAVVRAPHDLRVRAFTCQRHFGRGRVAAALQLLTSADLAAAPDDDARVRWHSHRASIWMRMRDFDAAAAAIDEGRRLIPDHPWLAVDEAWLLFESDRRDEALAHVRREIERRPDRLGLHYLLCHALHEADDPAAIGAYRDAAARFQLPQLEFNWAKVLVERGQPAEAYAVLQQLGANYPLERRSQRIVLAARLAHVCRLLGRLDEALAHAESGGRPLRKLTEALRAVEGRDAASLPRLQLTVPFVRQDHVTCVPASMASVLAALGRTVDQREVARAITYDGTPDFLARDWCRNQGLVHREFRFDVDVIRALLAREVPVMFSTRFPFGAHMQVAIGYDPALGLLIVREPGVHDSYEYDAAGLQRDAAARGYRCVVVLPADRAPLLDGIELPAEADTGRVTSLQQALREHRLADALELRAAMTVAVDDPLAVEADRSLAYYVGRPEDALAATRRLFAAHPSDAYVRAAFVGELGETGQMREMRRRLNEWVVDQDVDPSLYVHLVEACASRASDHALATWVARRMMRSLSRLSRAWTAQAALLAADSATQEVALLCRRIASCLDPHDESLALEDFHGLRAVGREDDGLARLRRRVEQLGERGGAAYGSLAQALEMLDRNDEGIATLRDGMTRHDEPWLRILLFHALVDAGRRDEARAHLATCEGKVRPLDLHQLRARMAQADGDLAGSLAAYEAAAAGSPAQVGLQRRRLRALAEVAGLGAAADEAVRLAEQNPEHPAFVETLVTELTAAGREVEAEAALRTRIESHPEETWAAFELATLLRRLGRVDEALVYAEQAVAQRPSWSGAQALHGTLLAAKGDRAGALAAHRRSLGLMVANTYALYHGLQSASDDAEARDLLRYFADELERQGPEPDALAAFVDFATDRLPDADVRAALERMAAEYPGRPAPLEALVQYLRRRRDVPGAVAAAERAVAQFPFRVEARAALAQARLAAHDHSGAERDARAAVEIDPRSQSARCLLGECLEAQGRFVDADEVYRQGIAALPTSAMLHVYSADLVWRMQRPDDALALLDRAHELDSDYAWILDKQVEWRIALERRPEALARARASAARQQGVPAAWNALAEALIANGELGEAVDAYQRALALDPRLGGARDAIVQTLVDLHRLDDARAAIDEWRAESPEDPRLAAREVWMQAMAGDVAGAAVAMRELARARPEDAFRWYWLRTWWNQLDRKDDLLVDAVFAEKAGVEYEPFWIDAVAAANQRGDKESARRWLKAAVRRAGGSWARVPLATMLEADKRGDEAARLFDDLDLTHAPQDIVAAALRARLRRGDVDAARAAFEAMFVGRRMFDAKALRAAAEAFPIRHLLRRRAWANELAASKDPDVQIGVALFRVLLDPENAEALRRLLRVLVRGQDGELRLRAAVDCLYEVDEDHRLRNLLREDLPATIHDGTLWGMIGAVLVTCGEYEAIVARMLPQIDRYDAEAWALCNLAMALVGLDRIDDLERVVERALSRPRDHSYWWHRALMAWVRIRRGDHAGARQWLDAPPQRLAGARALIAELRFLVAAEGESSAGARRAAFHESLFDVLDGIAEGEKRQDKVRRSLPFRAYRRTALRRAPSLAALVLQFGRPGRFVLRLWYGRGRK